MAKSQPRKHKLTDAFVRDLEPGDSAYLVWDTVQQGFVVRVQTTGNKVWYAIYKASGRKRDYRIGAVSAIKLDDARRLAGRIVYQAHDGKDPQAERKAARSNGTFEEVSRAYFEYASGKNKSWKQAEALVKRNLLPRLGKIKAAEVSRSDMRAAIAAIKAPITANQTLAAGSAIFSWAIKNEVSAVKLNPCVGIERNKTTKRKRVLSEKEIPLFWAEFGKAGLPGLALKTLLLLGQRPGEVAHMRVEHIEDGWWSLPGLPLPDLDWPGTKNAQNHRVWMPEPAQQTIAGLDFDGMVFAGERGGLVDLEGAMRTICKTLGVERATPHDLRRTHGSTVTALGFGRDRPE
jgi:integrase